MSPLTTSFIGLLTWIVVAITLPLGLLFLWRGRRPRAVGKDPHCRACHYNLTGLTSARCPECGAELTDEAVVIGRSTRRRGWIAPQVNEGHRC